MLKLLKKDSVDFRCENCASIFRIVPVPEIAITAKSRPHQPKSAGCPFLVKHDSRHSLPRVMCACKLSDYSLTRSLICRFFLSRAWEGQISPSFPCNRSTCSTGRLNAERRRGQFVLNCRVSIAIPSRQLRNPSAGNVSS